MFRLMLLFLIYKSWAVSYLTYSCPQEANSSWEPSRRYFKHSLSPLMVMASTDTTSAQKRCKMQKFHQKCCHRFIYGTHHKWIFAYFILSRSHAIIDLLQLAIVRAQELEGLGYRGHGSRGRANQSAQFLQSRMVQSCVLFLQVNRETSVCFMLSHAGENIEKGLTLTLSLSTIISKSSCNCLSSSDWEAIKGNTFTILSLTSSKYLSVASCLVKYQVF